MSELKPCEAIEILESIYPSKKQIVTGEYPEVAEALDMAIAALRRAQPANEPLTLEQVIERRGEPLWYQPVKDGEGTPFDYDPAWFICNLDRLPEPFYLYGKTWLAYDHKQGGEQT